MVRVWRVALSAMGTAVLAACGAAASTPTTLPPTPTPVIIATLPPTALPTLNPAEAVGQTVTTTTQAAVTVERTAPAQTSFDYQSPPPGGSFLAVEIKECAGNQVLFVSPDAWSVKLADATQVDAQLMIDMAPSPELASTNLNPGGCTDGWVYFPIPAGAHPIEIHLLRADFYWTLQ